MTINIADNSPRISYSVADGVTQTSFAVPFEFFDDEDLNVYVDGTLKTLTSDYTVAGGDGSTGTVTISVTGASGGSTVVITRDITLERTTDFPVSGAFNIVALNTELDRLVAVAADLDDRASRALQLTDYDVAVGLTLPDVDTRKGKTLAFNLTTGAVEAGPSTSDVQSVSDTAADIALLADIQDGTVATNAITIAASNVSNISTVAGISGNVTTVAGINANVTTVAGISADVTTVAGISDDVTEVAGISTQVTTVADGFDTGNLDFTGTATISSTLSVGGDIVLEGATANDFETTLTVTDPTADRTITFPDTTGTVVLQQDFTSWSDVNAIDQGLATTDTVTFANVETSGYLRGPASFTIDPASHGDNTGTVVIAGNLQVDGTTTTVNSTTMTVDDVNITVASGAANAAAADGAGLTIDGANITLAYDDTDSVFDVNYDFRVSGDLSTLNSGGYINLFEASDSSGVFTKFADATSGKTTTDGFLVGLDSSQKAILRNYEATDMELGTSGSSRLRIGASGNVLVETGNQVRLLGSSDSLYTAIARTTPTGANTATLQDKSGTVALEDGSGNLFLNDDTALLSPQSASTSSTATVAIATFAHATWQAAKAIITASQDLGGGVHNTQITEMLIAHTGGAAYATEYGNLHTGNDPIATFDVDMGLTDLRILVTPASTTATTYKIVLILT